MGYILHICFRSNSMTMCGINYLQNILGHELAGPIAVSKYFEAHESWTQKPTWWFNLPIEKIESALDKNYYLVGEAKNIGKEFIVLSVPNRFLLDNIDLRFLR